MPTWAVSAFDLTGHQDGNRHVDLSLDRATVAAGETANLTVTRRSRNPRKQAIVGIVSSVGVHSYMWPLAVTMD